VSTFEERIHLAGELAQEVKRVMEINHRRRGRRGLKSWEKKLEAMADAVLDGSVKVEPAPAVQLQVPTQEFKQGRFIEESTTTASGRRNT
jgi:hypothetical protein